MCDASCLIQQVIAYASYQYQKEVESGERVIVGVNKFAQKEEDFDEVFNIDESIRAIQIEKLKQLKAGRNNGAVEAALNDLKKAAQGSENLMPFILLAVEEYATLGEIANCLREVFGEY